MSNTAPAAKIKFIVIEECALAYVYPERPEWAMVLQAHVTRGALGIRTDDNTYLTGREVRPATRADFDTYRIHSEGYARDTERYDFPAV